MIKPYLDDLEERIDDCIESELMIQWVDFCEGNFKGDLFMPKRGKKAPSKLKWPEVRINETLEDYDKMALQQYKTCSYNLETGNGGIMNVRCNYGTSIIPSLFGVELFVMDDKYNTLPTSRQLKGGIDEIKKIIDEGIPNIYNAYGEKVFEMGRRFVEIHNKYPKIKKHIHIYHPDLQGPMDICELLAGSEIFYYIIDYPEIIHQMLQLVTETYILFMREWLKITPQNGEYSVHWNILHKGTIMLRDDSAMNMSPAIFDEFIKPYDQRLLKEFGGGAIHFCGRGDHYIKSASELEGLYAINLSQPEYNNMETIFTNTVDKGIAILKLKYEAAEAALKTGRDLHSKVHC